MICPVCKIELISVEHDRIELDYCVKCKGVWFDSNELELLLDKLGIKNHGLSFEGLISKIDDKHPEIKRRCPICKRRMGKVEIDGNPRVVIDICSSGYGLWLDGGEAIQLIKHTSLNNKKKEGSEQKIINFLGEVFKI